jgi:hypothetical protein
MPISDLFGLMSLCAIACFVMVCAFAWPKIAKLLWVAFVIRTAATLFHIYVSPLPDSSGDALTFEHLAFEHSQGSFLEVLTDFPGPGSSFYVWLISLAYTLMDRSLLLAQSMSVFMGVGTVLLGWLLARNLWGEQAAKNAGWVLAFFPSLVLYSAIVMREAYIHFFLLLAILGIVHWVREGGLVNIILAILGFVGCTFFHGAMAIGLLIFACAVLFRSYKQVLASFSVNIFIIPIFFLILVTIVLSIIFLSEKLVVYEVKDALSFTDGEFLFELIDLSTRSSELAEDGAAYPYFTVPNTLEQAIYKAPIRLGYFLFSPFPWDLRKITHIMGLFDSILYMALSLLLWFNRKKIWMNSAAKLLLLVLLGYLLVFSFGVGNFGTGFRHRAKFVAIFVLLVAPLLPSTDRLCLPLKKYCD